MNNLQSVVQEAWQQVIAQREEILRAFVARYGMQPDEIEQIEQRTATGWRWWVQPRRLTPLPPDACGGVIVGRESTSAAGAGEANR